MAELGANTTTLADLAKSLDPDGKPARVAEILSQKNALLEDIPFMEGNLLTGHQETIRAGLPSVSFRLLNQGTTPSKAVNAQVTFGVGMLDAWSEVDVKIAAKARDVNAYRLREAKAFIEAMGQEAAQTSIYGNQDTSPEEFTGLANYYTSTSDANGQNIILAGGAGADNSSIWLVGWGEDTVFGIYPRGSQAGLQHKDYGEVTVETTAGVGGQRMRALQEQFMWDLGLVVKDWRYAVRIANIDISDLVGKTGSAADLYDKMIFATHRIPNLQGVKPVFYMNRSCLQMLDVQGRDDTISGGGIKSEMVEGRLKQSFRGIPVKILDQLTETEAAVS